MELFLILGIGLVLVLSLAFFTFAGLIKQLKSSPGKKLLSDGKTIQVSFSISLLNKNEVGASDTNSITNITDKDSS